MASLRNKRLIIAPGQQYDFPLNGDSIRLTAANVPIYFKTRDGAFDFYLGVGEKADFKGQDFVSLIVYHLDVADQVVILSIGKDAEIGSALISGNVTITGAVDLSTASLTALGSVSGQNKINVVSVGQSYGASYRSTVNLAGNTPETVFTAAANANGAIIHSMQFYENSTGTKPAFLAKATAPANVTDGDAILSGDFFGISGTNLYVSGSLKNPLKISAGKGLFYITDVAAGFSSRSVLYALL